MERVEGLLERIAVALEAIAANLAESKAVPIAQALPEIQEVLSANTLLPNDEIEPEPDHVKVLEPFLAARHISIKVLPKEDPADQVIDSLSLFLGERYNALSSILMKVKRSMQTGDFITESLKDYAQLDVSSVCQFCTRLHEIAFLEQYQYSKSPVYLVRAKTTTLPKAQRFFGGQWLERFVLQKVKSVYSQVVTGGLINEIPFEYLINPQIILPNKDDFELDLLVSIGGVVYWIEAKSGDYQQHVSKYAKFARILGIEYARSIMVLTDASNERCSALSSLFTMTVCNLASFEDYMLSIISEDVAELDVYKNAKNSFV